MSRLDEFPLPEQLLPHRLKALLTPIPHNDPGLMVEVATYFDHDQHGNGREHVRMQMVAVPASKAPNLGVLREGAEGVAASGGYIDDKKGLHRKHAPSVSGFDPIVMSWGSGLKYAYNLSEKIWTLLALSPRAIGNDSQRMTYDDLTAPDFDIAQGEISNAHYFESDRNVSWTMRNDYLHQYLWMRNMVGVRSFYYEALLEDRPEVRAVMNGEQEYADEPEDGWYVLELKPFKGRLMLRVWATMPAVQSTRCEQPDAHKLIWPGDKRPMSEVRAGQAGAHVEYLYLKDTFLERYENKEVFDAVPVKTRDGQWFCSPSYGGQWSFVGCERLGRNLVRVEVYNLYKKAVPDREIVHAHAHAVSPQAAQRWMVGEHVVAKTQRLLDQVLDLGDRLADLSAAVGLPRKRPEDLVKYSRTELAKNGWHSYRILRRLARAAPLEMTEQGFLARCKTMNELLQQALPNELFKALLRMAGGAEDDLKRLGSLSLLQGLVNTLDGLEQTQDNAAAFKGSVPEDWKAKNAILAPLFVNYDLRVADAHEAGAEWLKRLSELGFDTAQVTGGYGPALDFVFDRVVGSLRCVNERLSALLLR